MKKVKSVQGIESRSEPDYIYIGRSDKASPGIQHWSKDLNNVKENVGENSATGRGKGK